MIMDYGKYKYQQKRNAAGHRAVAADPRREVGIAPRAVVAFVQPEQGQSTQHVRAGEAVALPAATLPEASNAARN